MSFDYGNPAGGRTDMVQKPKLDGFVKSQIGLLRCPLSPRTRRKLLKQLGILNAAGVQTLFPKEAMSLPNPTFYKTIKLQ
jgi:hypothetical protein